MEKPRGYNATMWTERYQNRGDITTRLTHLTREAREGEIELSPVEVLVKILNEQCIKGSGRNGSGSAFEGYPWRLKARREAFIVGPHPAVCFLDIPLLGLAQHIVFEKWRVVEYEDRIRYRGVGLSFDKRYAFRQGARPVVYEQTEEAKKFLPEDEHWRIVDLTLQSDNALTDWTHEREWRIRDEFKFDRGSAVVVLETTEQYREFLRLAKDVAQEVAAITVLELLLS